MKASDVGPSVSKADEIPSDLTLSEAQNMYEAGMRREALLFVQSLREMPEALSRRIPRLVGNAAFTESLLRS